MARNRIRKWSALVLGLLLVLSLVAQERVRELVFEFVGWIRDLGLSGAFVYGLAYIAATVALVPGLVLTIGAGFLYGPLWGSLLVMICSVAGASAAFLLARTWWRPWVLRKLEGRRTILALDERMGEEGWKIVFLLRLSPLVPFSILNYLLGVTRLRLLQYVGASAVGMIPGILLYCYIGSALATLGEASGTSSEVDSLRSALFWLGLFATLVVTIVVTRWAQRSLRELQIADAALES